MFKLVWVERKSPTQKTAFDVSFPGSTSDVKKILLRSSAIDRGTYETLQGLSFYLYGPDVQTIQMTWPGLGGASQPELSGGLEISFDDGRTYTRFSRTVGNESDPSTWIPLPKLAMGLLAVNGQLNPFDVAHITLRYVIPPGVDQYKVYDVSLNADFDII